MKYLFTLLLLSFIVQHASSQTSTGAKTFDPIPSLDLYLCIGQSNMAGRGTLHVGLMDTLKLVYLLNDICQFEQAVNPLNKYSTIRKEIAMQQLSPCYSFAKEMVKETGKPVGLIVNARGGSSIKEWMKGAKENYYGEALKRVHAATKYGQIKAILWHQGEADVCCPEEYRKILTQFVKDLREDLKNPTLFFVAGEVSRWDWTRNKEGTSHFNQMISSISSFIPYSACVSSIGLTPLKDESDPHFDAESQLILGKRYANKILNSCK